MMLLACAGFVVAAVLFLASMIMNGRSDSAPNLTKTRAILVFIGIAAIVFISYKLYLSLT